MRKELLLLWYNRFCPPKSLCDAERSILTDPTSPNTAGRERNLTPKLIKTIIFRWFKEDERHFKFEVFPNKSGICFAHIGHRQFWGLGLHLFTFFLTEWLFFYFCCHHYTFLLKEEREKKQRKIFKIYDNGYDVPMICLQCINVM